LDLDKLVDLTKGYSGADIFSVIKDASYMPLRRKLNATGFNLDDL
jgi:SpoVK/Ycf46/Vps4 family AAA+-type ATPase